MEAAEIHAIRLITKELKTILSIVMLVSLDTSSFLIILVNLIALHLG